MINYGRFISEKGCVKVANIRLPIGKENFEELRISGGYYVDKSRFIADLLRGEQFSVNLITRPRRFGKTLTMSMLKNFFDIRKDSRGIFEGLSISEDKELCAEWMNQWPVLFISLKDVSDAEGFPEAYEMLAYEISDLCIEHAYLLNSEKVDEDDKKRFAELKSKEVAKTDVKNSLYLLTRMMHRHYGKQVILLIDEYDVPLAKAHEYGYYRKMLDVIRGMMSKSLKTNEFLKFAIVTGCLRIAKESIFTGTNHFVENSIYDGNYMDIFGFTEKEVRQILSDANLEEHIFDMKRWYDGYHFGGYDIYCPWDVVNYAAVLMRRPNQLPGNYWKDTSHNDIIRSFIGNKKLHVNDKFETLLAGGYVKVSICEDLTYDLVDSTEDNLWSILYLTGYLTLVGEDEVAEDDMLKPGEVCLVIPNEEVKTIFEDTIVRWFKDTMRAENLTPLMLALWEGNGGKATRIVSDLLFKTISYHNYKEDFYHAFLAGIFVGVGYPVESDKEHGEGRPDVVVKDMDNRRVIILEAKRSKCMEDMEKDCQQAFEQINVQRYAEDFLDGYRTVICYGVAFYKKQCLIKRIDVPVHLTLPFGFA